MNQKIHLMTTRCKIETTRWPPCNFACEKRKPFGDHYGFGHEEAKPPSGNWVVLVVKEKKKPLGGCQLVFFVFVFSILGLVLVAKKKTTWWFLI